MPFKIVTTRLQTVRRVPLLGWLGPQPGPPATPDSLPWLRRRLPEVSATQDETRRPLLGGLFSYRDQIGWLPRLHATPDTLPTPVGIQPPWGPALATGTPFTPPAFVPFQRLPPAVDDPLTIHRGPTWNPALLTGTPLAHIAFVPIFPPQRPPDPIIEIRQQPRWNPLLSTGTPLTPVSFVPFRPIQQAEDFEAMARRYPSGARAGSGNQPWNPGLPPSRVPQGPVYLARGDRSLSPRMARNMEILSEMFNSLTATHQLVRDSQGNWKIVPQP